MEFKPLTRTNNDNEGKAVEENESEIRQFDFGKPNKNLENGLRLGEKHRKLCTDDKTGIPLEEIDPFFKKGTFVIIGPRTHVIHRFNSTDTTCLKLKVTNPFRGLALTILTHWLFTALLTKIIIWNCIGCALNFQSSFISLTTASLIVLGFELILKVIARGFYNRSFSYVRMGWNWLDLFIIFVGIISLIEDAFYWFTILTTFKLIQLTPGMLSAAIALKNNLKKILDFVIFLMFPLLILSLIGLQIYMGILTSKCIRNMPGITNVTTGDDIEEFEKNSTNWWLEDDGYKLCGNATISCPENYTCKIGFGANPNFDYTNFDTYFWAVFNVIRLFFQDYEMFLYQQLLTVAGFWHFLFFAVAFFFGTFLLGSFAYAIIAKDLLYSLGNDEKSKISEEFSKLSREQVSENIGRIRQNCKDILTNRIYEFFVTIIIILDILFLFSHHYGVTDVHFSVTLGITGVAVIVYAVEFVLKLIAESPVKYFCKFWNCFDFLVIILALIYFCLYGIEFLRKEELTRNVSFYSIRALKLTPRWPSLGFLFKMMFDTMKSFLGLFGLFGVFVFNLSLLGYILFSTIYTGNFDPRWNFTVFWKSLASVLRILGGEWIELFWDFLRFGDGFYTSLVYTAIAVLAGNLIVMTLAMATVLTTKTTLDKQTSSPEMASKRRTALQLMCLPCTWISTKFSGYCKLQTTTMYKVAEENMATAEAGGQGGGGAVVVEVAPLPENKFRGKVKSMTELKVIKGKSIVMVIIGSLALAFTDVIGIYYVDTLFTVYFIVEMISRVIGLGVKSSLRNFGLIFDFVIILEMILNFTQYHNFGIILNCATGSCGYFYLRNFRPLMLISRIDRLKVIARGIFYEILELNSYIWASLYIWLVFSIIGVHNFGGQFHNCVDDDDGTAGYIRNKEECLLTNLTWNQPDNNFNDISSGLLALLHVGSLDSWIPILHDAIDSFGVDVQPIADSNPLAMIYFIIFYIVGVFFVLNILFGVMVHNFPKGKVHEVFRTKVQIESYEKSIKEEKITAEIPKPENKCLEWCFRYVTSTKFQIKVMVFILIDLVAYASDEFNQSQVREDVLMYIHGIILIFYTVETILKIIGLRKYYFKCPLNIFDLIVVLSSIFGLILSDLISKYFISPILLRILRSLRLLRLFKSNFLRRIRILNLFTSIKLTIPVFINFLLFYLLFVYSYMILGFEMFKNLNSDQPQLENFNNLQNSFSTLFEMSTFGGWASVLQTFRGMALETGADEQTSSVFYPPFKISALFICSFLALTFIVVATVYLVFILEIINQFDMSKQEIEAESESDPVRRTKELKDEDIEIGEIPKRELNSAKIQTEEIDAVLTVPD